MYGAAYQSPRSGAAKLFAELFDQSDLRKQDENSTEGAGAFRPLRKSTQMIRALAPEFSNNRRTPIYKTRCRSFNTAIAAFRPLIPITDPPGCVAAPQR